MTIADFKYCLLQTEELQGKIDAMDPELFVGQPDEPDEPDAIDTLLEGSLPGTAGFLEDTDMQVDFMRDILPEGTDDVMDGEQNGKIPA